MIPTIGTMVGFYIITRMIEAFQKNTESKFLRFMAGLTIFIAIVSIIDLLNAGSKGVG